MNSIIQVKNLVKIYNGAVKALDKINFEAKQGEIFGFLGPNGAGKTTTIKILSTLIKPTNGSAFVNGYDVVKQPKEVRRSIGIVFQEPALDDQLTGRENLDYHARMYSISRSSREKRIKEVLELVGLQEKADILVKYYSGGMKRRLEIARGLMHYPKVLFLDEPTLGLDTQTRRAIWEYIKQLNKKEKITIFLTTHYMEEADYLCDRVAIIDQGKIIAIGTPSKLKNSLGKDVITVRCSNPNALKTKLEKKKWINRMKQHDSFLNIYVTKGEEKIARVIQAAERVKVKIESINLRKPSLEDVYLHYTGKNIREEKVRYRFIPRRIR